MRAGLLTPSLGVLSPKTTHLPLGTTLVIRLTLLSLAAESFANQLAAELFANQLAH